jgi:hypothetical protein
VSTMPPVPESPDAGRRRPGPGGRWWVSAAWWLAPLVLMAAGLGPPLLLWSRLPPRVADHWAFGPVPNGSHPKLIAIASLVPLLVAGTLAMAWWAYRRRGRVTLVLLFAGVALGATGVASSVLVTVTNLDLRTWREARLNAAELLGVALGPTLAAIAVTALAVRTRRPTDAPDRSGTGPSLGLGAQVSPATFMGPF